MRKWSKAPRILSLLAVMIAAAVGFAPAAHAAESDVMIGDSAYASVPEAVKAIVDKKEPQGSTIKLTKNLTGPGVQVHLRPWRAHVHGDRSHGRFDGYRDQRIPTDDG